MTAYYEEIKELWNAGEFFSGISYFGQYLSKGLLLQEEIENLSKNIPKCWELVEVQCQENAEVIFKLYEMLKKARNWDDETFYRKLKISGKAIEDIKSHRRPRSKAAGLRMLYELFPQMAV